MTLPIIGLNNPDQSDRYEASELDTMFSSADRLSMVDGKFIPYRDSKGCRAVGVKWFRKIEIIFPDDLAENDGNKDRASCLDGAAFKGVSIFRRGSNLKTAGQWVAIGSGIGTGVTCYYTYSAYKAQTAQTDDQDVRPDQQQMFTQQVKSMQLAAHNMTNTLLKVDAGFTIAFVLSLALMQFGKYQLRQGVRLIKKICSDRNAISSSRHEITGG